MEGLYKVGVYDEEEKLVSSIKGLVDKGIKIYEVYTPYPMHSVIKLLKRKSRLPTAGLLFGLSGAVAVLAFLYYTSVISWPIVYGGKPFNSFPSFIIITIVLTIFIVTIASLGTFSARSKLIPGTENPVFDERATDDKFIIVLSDADMNPEHFDEASGIMKNGGAVEVVDKTFEEKNKQA
jgi:hypothetical protein